MKMRHGFSFLVIFGIGLGLGQWFRDDGYFSKNKKDPSPPAVRTVTFPGDESSSAGKPRSPKGRTIEFADALKQRRDLMSWISELPQSAFVDTFESSREDNTLRQMIAARWAEVDPEALLGYLLRKRGIGSDWEALFSVWIRRDSEGAINSLAKAPAKDRETVRRFLFRELFQYDVDLAIESYRTKYGNVFPDIPEDVVRANPEKVARFIVDSKVIDYTSKRDLADAVSYWYESEPGAVLKFVSGLRGASAAAAIPVIRKWVAQDPAGAADFIKEHLAIEARREASQELAKTWAQTDPRAAWDWVRENLMGQQESDALRDVILSAAKVDPVVSVEMIRELPEGRQLPMLSSFAVEFFRRDRDSALEWALDQHDPEYRAGVLRAISGDWAGADFRAMGKFSRENIDSLPVEFVEPLATRWGGIYPMEVMGWQTKIPDSHGVPVAKLAMQSWARKTPQAAAKFLSKMGHPEKRTGAFPLVADQYLRQDREGGIAWLKSLADDRRFTGEAVRNAVTESRSISEENRDIILREIGMKN